MHFAASVQSVTSAHLSSYEAAVSADVACDWLACFPFTARKHVYDVFFNRGLATKVVQTLVPCLSQKNSTGPVAEAVLSNIERFVSCLLVPTVVKISSSSSPSSDYYYYYFAWNLGIFVENPLPVVPLSHVSIGFLNYESLHIFGQ